MEVAELAMRHLGRPVSNTPTRIAALTFYERLTKASKEWDEVTARLDDRVLPGGELDEDKAEDSLVQWLERFDMTDVDNRGHAIHEHRGIHATINMSEVDLYRCSWCGNPSAILRKCRGCGKTRCTSMYHWKYAMLFCLTPSSQIVMLRARNNTGVRLTAKYVRACTSRRRTKTKIPNRDGPVTIDSDP